MADAGKRLGGGRKDEIEEVVVTVRAAHPDASNGAIVNYLITAYCPRIKANPSLSHAGKQNTLKSFAARAEKIVTNH